jgi:hypothetical protein
MSGKQAEKKEICPHRLLFIHDACVVEAPACVQCPNFNTQQQSYGISYEEFKREKKRKRSCAQRWKLGLFYCFLIGSVALVLGYFLPRMAHRQLHEELPPFNPWDLLIGGLTSLLTGMCVVSWCVCGGCCCKKGFDICILCKCFE